MQQVSKLEGCFMWLLRVSETMMKHFRNHDKALQSTGLHATTLYALFIGQLYACQVLMLQATALTQIQLLCLHPALGTVIMQHQAVTLRAFLSCIGGLHFQCCLTSIQFLLRSSCQQATACLIGSRE